MTTKKEEKVEGFTLAIGERIGRARLEPLDIEEEEEIEKE